MLLGFWGVFRVLRIRCHVVLGFQGFKVLGFQGFRVLGLKCRYFRVLGF